MQSKAQIDQSLRQKCEAKDIPGVVAMAATGSEVRAPHKARVKTSRPNASVPIQ